MRQVSASRCIQRWSRVAKWGGVRVSEIMKIVRPKHGAAEPGLFWDAHKINHMHHDNSILAYEMIGKPLPEVHRALGMSARMTTDSRTTVANTVEEKS